MIVGITFDCSRGDLGIILLKERVKCLERLICHGGSDEDK